MPTGPGPRQRRATKIANRSHVTPFDKLAQWNAEIMKLGTQGAVPSIVGNSLEFVKLTAADIPGVLNNPANADLDMNSFGIIKANRLEVDTSQTPYVSITGITSSTLTVKSTSSALIEMEGPVSTILRGKSKLKIETDNNASSNNIEISPYGTLALQALGTGGAGNGNIVIGNTTLALLDLSGSQINLDAGTTGLQMGSDGGITIDASNDIEIDAAGRLDLSGSQLNIEAGANGLQLSSNAKVTIDAVSDIELDSAVAVDIGILGNSRFKISSGTSTLTGGVITALATNSINLSCGGGPIDISAPRINIGTSSSTVDISGQITLNNVSKLTATDISATDITATTITATGAIEGASFATGSRTGNTITTQGTVTTGAITDGTATMSSGTITGLVSLTANSISDTSGATLTNGSMTGLIDVSTNSITLKNTEFTSTSQTRDLSNAPYVWGVNYLEQIDPTDQYLVGSYKQIKSALFYWEGDEGISYSPPNNVPTVPGTGPPVVNPPCQGGGELLLLGTPKIWDLPAANYQAGFHTFTIPQVVERTMMTVELSIDIWYDSTGQARSNTVFFWLGKSASGTTDGGGSGPRAYRMATHMPSYFGTDAMEPTFCHNASITLLGGDAILPYHPTNPRFEFHAGDTFYLTAQCMGSPSFPRYKTLRVKVTWEALN